MHSLVHKHNTDNFVYLSILINNVKYNNTWCIRMADQGLHFLLFSQCGILSYCRYIHSDQTAQYCMVIRSYIVHNIK